MERALLALVSVLAVTACGLEATAPGDDSDRHDDGPPIKIKTPPQSKDGNDSAEACDGVTELGECRSNVAVFCDLELGAVRKSDCAAQGRQCVIDSARGAMCATLSGAPAPDPDSVCDSGFTSYGFCSGSTAVWCDEQSEQTVAWECGSESLTCQIDNCADGAYCCDGSVNQSDCDLLGLAGDCFGNTVRYCDGDEIIEYACSGTQQCKKDECLPGGAECCDPGASGRATLAR